MLKIRSWVSLTGPGGKRGPSHVRVERVSRGWGVVGDRVVRGGEKEGSEKHARKNMTPYINQNAFPITPNSTKYRRF
jgi:hypothetical protein